MLALAVFGIKNGTINAAVELICLFLVVIWLALLYWTYADARRRILDPMLVGCAAAAALFPFVGTIVYMIVRPPEYLDDVREREQDHNEEQDQQFDDQVDRVVFDPEDALNKEH